MGYFGKKEIIKYILISAGVNLLIAALAIFVFGVRYVIDDDPSMAYIAYGIYMKPSARIMFSNVIFGETIKLLFRIKPNINWQVGLYFVGLCAGGFISLYEILKTEKTKYIFLWLLFVSCFFHTSYCYVTFTIVAAYICSQGFLAFFLAVKERNRICMILSGMAIFFASLLRFLSVMAISMMVFVAWVLIVIYEYINCEEIDIKKRLSTLVSRYVIPFVALFVVLGVGFGVDRIAYSYSEWAVYDKFTNLRSDILDNASIIVAEDFEKQAELGISPAMAASLKNWKFNDPDVFTTELFEEILEVSLDLRAKFYPHPFKDMWISVWGLLKSNFIFQTCLMGLIILNVISFYRFKTIRLKNFFLFATSVPFFAQIFVYCYMGRYDDAATKTFPSRVIEMALMGFCICLMLVEICLEDGNEKQGLWRCNLTTWCVAIILTFSIVSQVEKNYPINGFSLKSESMIEDEYSYLNDGHIYVMDWKAYQVFMNEYRVWQNPPQGYLNNITLLGGSEIKYPLLVEKEKKLGVQNPYKSLYDDENVYLVSVEYPEIELNYLRETYNDSIECELVASHETLDVYNFVVRSLN